MKNRRKKYSRIILKDILNAASNAVGFKPEKN
jgi:hypothetical protein